MIDCKAIANEIKKELKQELNKMSDKPKLAIIQVGNNPASNNYIKGKIKDCEEIGIEPKLFNFTEDENEDKILETIGYLNRHVGIHGIIVQLPLPSHMDEAKILGRISRKKDVDGFTQNSPFVPCTPLGVLTLLDKLEVDIKGRTIALVGFGKLVNKPLFSILSDMGAIMVVCRSNTPRWKLEFLCKNSDIIISATGVHGIIDKNCISCWPKSQVIIDCGIQVINGKQYGDCSEDIYELVERTTPRINGVGLMTRAALMQNVVKACEEQNKWAK